MALARVQVQYKDANGYKASADYPAIIADGATLTQVDDWLTVWVGKLNTLTNGIIYGAEVHVIGSLTGFTAHNGSGSNLISVLGLSFPLNAVPGRFDVIVPALNPSLIVGGKPDGTEGGTIDLVTDYMENAFQVAAAGDSNFCNRQGIALVEIADPFLAKRKFGSQLRRKGRFVGV
jgi:hypothetical protein